MKVRAASCVANVMAALTGSVVDDVTD